MSGIEDRREEEEDEHSHYRNECGVFSCRWVSLAWRVERCCLFGKVLPCIKGGSILARDSLDLSFASTTMSSYVPPELIDQIIDYLRNDSKSLNACALTARNWVPSARYHRFRSIRFHSAKKIDSFNQLSQDAPSLLPYYQEAIICDNSGYVPASILEAAASACLTLPNLERIKFNNRIYASTPRVITILSPIAVKITTLNLSGTLFASSNDFWPLICSFPNLSTVQACGVTFGSIEETAFSPLSTYEPPITTFSVSTSRQGFVIEHLINPPFPLRFLENFEILYIDPNQTTLVPLAESIQKTVKQLRFGAVSIHRADDQSGSPFSSDHSFWLADPSNFARNAGLCQQTDQLGDLDHGQNLRPSSRRWPHGVPLVDSDGAQKRHRSCPEGLPRVDDQKHRSSRFHGLVPD